MPPGDSNPFLLIGESLDFSQLEFLPTDLFLTWRAFAILINEE